METRGEGGGAGRFRPPQNKPRAEIPCVGSPRERTRLRGAGGSPRFAGFTSEGAAREWKDGWGGRGEQRGSIPDVRACSSPKLRSGSGGRGEEGRRGRKGEGYAKPHAVSPRSR